MHYWGAYALHGELHALFLMFGWSLRKLAKKVQPGPGRNPQLWPHHIPVSTLREGTSPSDLAAWRPCLGASATPAHSTLKAKKEEAPDYTKEPKLKMKPTGFLCNKDALLLARLW